MTIRSRLNLSLAAAISIMLVFSGLIVRELGRVTSVVRDNLKVNALTKQIILLHSLTHDYLDAPSTRAEVQWQANYATLKKLLQEMQRDPDGITRIPPHVVENYDNIQENFAQITAVARREGWVDSGQSVRIGALESQFFAQLLTKNQELYDWMLTASAASNNRLLSAMRRDSLLFVGLLLAITLVVAVTLYLLKQGLLQSITRLRRGVDTIRRGDLNHRIDSTSRDEFGELSSAFNAMTADLQALYEKLEAKHRDLLNREQRFRALVEHATDCVMIAGADASITYLSPSFQHVLGYVLEDLQTQGILALVHPDDQARLREAFGRLLESSEPVFLTARVRHRNGDWRTIEAVGGNLLSVPAVAGLVINFRDITERRQAEESRRASEEKFSLAFKHSPMLMTITALADGTFLDVNDQFVAVTGFSRAELLGKTSVGVGWISAQNRQQLLARMTQQGRVDNLELEFSARDGRKFECLYSGDVITLDGQPQLFSIAQDISARKKMEDQLRQKQKMEAIGQLAGGVAHDFNNLLTAMIMNLSMLQEETDLPPGARERVGELEGLTTRAADLTRQLLQFSRRQVMRKQVLDLNKVLDNLLRMLGRLIGENIRLDFRPSADPVRVHADAGMMEQVVINLALNARDAMPGGGRLILQSETVDIHDHEPPAHPDARSGRFARLTVQDNGTGMDGATLQRIYEPFFTTKEAGRGTGLGLSTVFGIVQQHHGWIEVQSTPGEGTTFRVLIPAHVLQAPDIAQQPILSLQGGQETILLVEDELSVRSISAAFLRQKGYRILEASNGEEALAVWHKHRGDIQLVLTDMVMPDRMNGLDLAKRLQAESPGLPVILCTGYSLEIERYGVPAGITVLYKPIPPATLTSELRKQLDAAAQARQGQRSA